MKKNYIIHILYFINLLISRDYIKLHKIVADTVFHACAIIRALLLRLMLEMNSIIYIILYILREYRVFNKMLNTMRMRCWIIIITYRVHIHIYMLQGCILFQIWTGKQGHICNIHTQGQSGSECQPLIMNHFREGRPLAKRYHWNSSRLQKLIPQVRGLYFEQKHVLPTPNSQHPSLRQSVQLLSAIEMS